jgi:hypothetical protein
MVCPFDRGSTMAQCRHPDAGYSRKSILETSGPLAHEAWAGSDDHVDGSMLPWVLPCSIRMESSLNPGRFDPSKPGAAVGIEGTFSTADDGLLKACSSSLEGTGEPRPRLASHSEREPGYLGRRDFTTYLANHATPKMMSISHSRSLKGPDLGPWKSISLYNRGCMNIVWP